MTFGPLHCPDSCCVKGGPFDFYGTAVSGNRSPQSAFDTGAVDMLYLCDSVRENPDSSDPYTSADVSWFTDYCTNPVPHAADDKGDLIATLAAWPGTGEYVWVIRNFNRSHPESGQGPELVDDTGDLVSWTKGADVTTTTDIMTNTADSATLEAFIYKNLTLQNGAQYALRIVPTALECTKLQISIEGGPTQELDLTSQYGGELTQVDEDTYEYLLLFTYSGTTGAKRVEIRMVTSGDEYDGLPGDRVKIEWTSLRVYGSGANVYDLSLCSVVPGTVLKLDYVSADKNSEWKYTFPKVPLAEVGNPSNVEGQGDYPSSEGFSPLDIIGVCAKGKRWYNWGYNGILSAWYGAITQNWQANASEAAFLETGGSAHVFLRYTDDYGMEIGGPLLLYDVTIPPYGNDNLISAGQDSPFVEWWDSVAEEWKPKKYYYESGDWTNLKQGWPYPVGIAPHGYPNGFGYLECRQPVWDGAQDTPWTSEDYTEETNYSTVQEVSLHQTALVTYGGIGEADFLYYRSPPNDPHVNNWSDQLTATPETVITGSNDDVFWSKEHTTSRVISRVPRFFEHWDPEKIVIKVGRLTADINVVTVEAVVLWADANPDGNAKAIISWRTRDYVITDPNGGQNWVPTWHSGDDPDTKPVETAQPSEYGVEVTGGPSVSGLASWAECEDPFRGLCAIGDGFVFFERIINNEWRMHVHLTSGEQWTLDSTVGETSRPDCVAASERHFYVSSFHLTDNRMEDGYATSWSFGHKESDPAWPIRGVGDGWGGKDSIEAFDDVSSGEGTLNHDSIKNSSVLPFVPEQNRWPDRVP